MSKGIQIAIGFVAIVALIGWYALGNLGEASFVYYQTLEEFRSSAGPNQAARVHGYVTPGSIERDVPGRQVRFLVQEVAPHAGGDDSAAMPVIYTSLETPDLFQDGAEVVVEGRLARANGPFTASNVLAKCPSKFEAAAANGATPPSI